MLNNEHIMFNHFLSKY